MVTLWIFFAFASLLIGFQAMPVEPKESGDVNEASQISEMPVFFNKRKEEYDKFLEVVNSIFEESLLNDTTLKKNERSDVNREGGVSLTAIAKPEKLTNNKTKEEYDKLLEWSMPFIEKAFSDATALTKNERFDILGERKVSLTTKGQPEISNKQETKEEYDKLLEWSMPFVEKVFLNGTTI
ncbi:unnamed protein product, partial [Iphiclides podalirius]